ncbi:MAG: LapA family protein [Candidatus Omnitrophica bacterium]|nr:LapA family protein [Candidatus Omnitrophota bacterium]
MTAKFTTVIFLALLFLLVLAQNSQLIELRFLFWHFSVSRIILLPLLVFIGLLLGFVWGRRSRKRS